MSNAGSLVFYFIFLNHWKNIYLVPKALQQNHWRDRNHPHPLQNGSGRRGLCLPVPLSWRGVWTSNFSSVLEYSTSMTQTFFFSNVLYTYLEGFYGRRQEVFFFGMGVPPTPFFFFYILKTWFFFFFFFNT